jgi:hypothetical protein
MISSIYLPICLKVHAGSANGQQLEANNSELTTVMQLWQELKTASRRNNCSTVTPTSEPKLLDGGSLLAKKNFCIICRNKLLTYETAQVSAHADYHEADGKTNDLLHLSIYNTKHNSWSE